MTIWPQFASFSETERGMLIQGMEATFFLCAKPISTKEIPVENYSLATFVRGKKVFDAASY
jgi:predicted amidohydrolase YtcJ